MSYISATVLQERLTQAVLLARSEYGPVRYGLSNVRVHYLRGWDAWVVSFTAQSLGPAPKDQRRIDIEGARLDVDTVWNADDPTGLVLEELTECLNRVLWQIRCAASEAPA